MPRHLTSQVCGGHNGLLSVMQRGLFNLKYTYGCWVIGPCMYITHRSVLTSHRSSALEVLGWNRVRKTHSSASEKKKTFSMLADITTATSWCTNYSQACFKLFVLTRKCCPTKVVLMRRFNVRQQWVAACGQNENSLRSVGVYGTEGRRSRQGCLKMRRVLTVCRPTVIAAQAALWFSDQCFPEEKENSNGPVKIALWSRVERRLHAMARMINSERSPDVQKQLDLCISNCGQQCRLESAPVKPRACDRRATIDTDV